jgi:hypothetical protein
MDNIFVQVQYEKQGYRKGAVAKVLSTGNNVILVSNPKIHNNKVYVWVAMQHDTYLKYIVNIDDLELV